MNKQKIQRLKNLRYSVQHLLELTRELVSTDFKLMYKHSFLGVLWLIIKPTFNFLVMNYIWKNLFHAGPEYSVRLLASLAGFTLFQSSLKMGMNSLLNKSSIILKVNFRRELVVLSSTIVAFINFLITMIPFAIVVHLSGITIELKGLILYGLVIINLYLIGLAFAMFLSVIQIRVRDIKHIIELVLQTIYWATPVIYDMSRITGDLVKYVKMNPLTQFFVAIKLAVIHSDKVLFSDYVTQFHAFLVILVILLASVIFFERYIYKVAEYY